MQKYYGRKFYHKDNVKDLSWDKDKPTRSIQESITRSIYLIRGRTKFRSKEIKFKNGNPESCVICFGEFKSDKQDALLYIFPGCDHVFHQGCLATWLDQSPCIESMTTHSLACPTCRTPAPTKHHLCFLGALVIHYRKEILTICMNCAFGLLIGLIGCLIFFRRSFFVLDS
jgi:hypothetical protein